MADSIDPDSIRLGGTTPEYYAEYVPSPPVEPGSICELPPATELIIPPNALLPLAQECLLPFPDPVPQIFVPPVPPVQGCQEITIDPPAVETCPVTEGSFLILKSSGPTASTPGGPQECHIKLEGLICADVPCPDGTAIEMDVTFGGAAAQNSYFEVSDDACFYKPTLHIEVPAACESNTSTFDIQLSGAITGSFSDIETTECSGPPDCGCSYKGFLHVDPACTSFTGSAEKFRFIGESVKNSSIEIVSRSIPECGFDLIGNLEVNACSSMSFNVLTADSPMMLRSNFTGQTLGFLDMSLVNEITKPDACSTFLKLSLGGGGGGGGGGAGLSACGSTTIKTKIKGTNLVKTRVDGQIVDAKPLIQDVTVENDCEPKVFIVEILTSPSANLKSAQAGEIVSVAADGTATISTNPVASQVRLLETLDRLDEITQDMRDQAEKVLVRTSTNQEFAVPGDVILTRINGTYLKQTIDPSEIIFIKKILDNSWLVENSVTSDNMLAVQNVDTFEDPDNGPPQKVYTGTTITSDRDIEDSDEDGNTAEVIQSIHIHPGVRIIRKTNPPVGQLPADPVYSSVTLLSGPALVVTHEAYAITDIVPLNTTCSPCQQVLTLVVNDVDINTSSAGGGGGGGGTTTSSSSPSLVFTCSEAAASQIYEQAAKNITASGFADNAGADLQKIFESYGVFSNSPTSLTGGPVTFDKVNLSGGTGARFSTTSNTSLTGGSGATLSTVNRVVFDKATKYDKVNLSGVANTTINTQNTQQLAQDFKNNTGAFSDSALVDKLKSSGAYDKLASELGAADQALSSASFVRTGITLNWLESNLVAAPKCSECCTGSSSYLELCGDRGGLLYLDNLAFSEGDTFSSNTVSTTGMITTSGEYTITIDVANDYIGMTSPATDGVEGKERSLVLSSQGITLSDRIFIRGVRDEEEIEMGGLTRKIKFSVKEDEPHILLRNSDWEWDQKELKFYAREILVCENGVTKRAYTLMTVPETIETSSEG